MRIGSKGIGWCAAPFFWAVGVVFIGVVTLIAVRTLLPKYRFDAQSTAITDIAQDDTGDEDTQVAPAQVEKYVKVYQAMQKDHSLTIDQATAGQGMSVSAFRALEAKIEADDVVREQVRRELSGKNAEKQSATDVPSTKNKSK